MTIRAREPVTNLEPLARRLREAALDVIWRQWRAVGAQAAAGKRAHSMVDPEALILISVTLMQVEPRLADLLNDWVALNSDLLSVQRMKNLKPGYPEAAGEGLSWLAGVALDRGKDARWRSFLTHTSQVAAARATPKSLRTNKTRAIRPRFASPATLMLQLRLGFGVGAKADVLGYLLATEGARATVREIASATSYTVAAVRRAAEDMAAAQLIHVSSGKPVDYRADRAGWTEVLGLTQGPPAWRSWHHRFAFVAAFLAHAQGASTHSTSPYAAGVKGRELLERHRSAFELDLVTVWSEHTPVADWVGFLESAVAALAKWMVEKA